MSGTVVTLTLVIAFVVAMTAFTLISIAEQANRQALDDQLRRIQHSLASEIRATVADAALLASGHTVRGSPNDAAGWAEVLSRRVVEAWHFHGVNTIFVVDSLDRVIVGAEQGDPAGEAAFRANEHLVRRMMLDVRERRGGSQEHRPLISPVYEQDIASAGLIFDGFGLAIAVVTGFNPRLVTRTPADLLIVIRELSKAEITQIGERYGLKSMGFSLASGEIPPLARPVQNPEGRTVGYLHAIPDLPGTRLLPTLVIAAGCALLAIALAFAALVQRLRLLALDLAREEAIAQRLATHDHLSGLLNRMSFDARLEEELTRARRTGHGFAVHLIDLDRFKEVNDSHGHHAGDVVIREVARRISDVVRGADVVARLGGDEFGVIQIETGSTLEAGALAARLRDAMKQPIQIGPREVEVGFSIGIALAPEDDLSAAELLVRADSALYQAKHDGRNRHRFYEASLDEAVRMKQLVEEELREAIVAGQLELHYQPQVSADGTRILGVEALVRWRHPARGMIPPGEFIPVAEECGLIVSLNEWVLRRACEDARRWPALWVSVNVSATQFKLANFAEQVMQTVREAGIDPQRLELELTEGMIVEDEAKAEVAIGELRRFGVKLALDDFGTGYSSLIYLRRFSFDKIKIDRSFLEAIEVGGESAILIHSVVHLGRALGLNVCAEGVETHEQRRFLQALGCHQLQGFVFSRPLPAAEIDRLLAEPEPFRRAA